MHIPYIHQWILRNPQLNWIEEKKKKSNFELMIYFFVTTAHHFHEQDIISLHIDIFSPTRTRHDRHKNLPSTVVQTWCKLKSISSPMMKVVSSDNWIHFYNYFFNLSHLMVGLIQRWERAEERWQKTINMRGSESINWMLESQGCLNLTTLLIKRHKCMFVFLDMENDELRSSSFPTINDNIHYYSFGV